MCTLPTYPASWSIHCHSLSFRQYWRSVSNCVSALSVGRVGMLCWWVAGLRWMGPVGCLQIHWASKGGYSRWGKAACRPHWRSSGASPIQCILIFHSTIQKTVLWRLDCWIILVSHWLALSNLINSIEFGLYSLCSLCSPYSLCFLSSLVYLTRGRHGWGLESREASMV